MNDLFSPEAGNDVIHIERDGVRKGPYRCMFSRPKLTLWYSELDIAEGDKVLRSIPGREESYTAELVDYHQSFDDIPPCYIINLRKDTEISKPKGNITTNHINIHGSTGIQIGDHNIQNLELAMKELLTSIENSNASPVEKQEVRNRLQSFLAHPLVNTAVGAGLTAALGLVG